MKKFVLVVNGVSYVLTERALFKKFFSKDLKDALELDTLTEYVERVKNGETITGCTIITNTNKRTNYSITLA